MCLHINGYAFGNISDPYLIDGPISELYRIATRHHPLWDHAFDELDALGIFELLDAAIWRDDDRPLDLIQKDSKRYAPYIFLNNWGEQFDCVGSCFIVQPNSVYRIIWQDDSGVHRSVDVPRDVFVSVVLAAHEWYAETLRTHRGNRNNEPDWK